MSSSTLDHFQFTDCTRHFWKFSGFLKHSWKLLRGLQGFGVFDRWNLPTVCHVNCCSFKPRLCLKISSCLRISMTSSIKISSLVVENDHLTWHWRFDVEDLLLSNSSAHIWADGTNLCDLSSVYVNELDEKSRSKESTQPSAAGYFFNKALTSYPSSLLSFSSNLMDKLTTTSHIWWRILHTDTLH